MDPTDLMPYFILIIPIVAISGGVIHGIVKTVGRQRLAELAQRERIAAIERGIDPSKLPPFIPPGGDPHEPGLTFAHRQLRTAQGLKIGGIITIAVGVGMGGPLVAMHEERGWLPGIVLLCIGLALLISARIIRPIGNGDSR
jgi:hypothetical protein